jgi:hypothetical protein
MRVKGTQLTNTDSSNKKKSKQVTRGRRGDQGRIIKRKTQKAEKSLMGI